MTAEERYLAALRRNLRDVPRRRRVGLIEQARDDLGERPDAEAWEQLVAELGTPDAYALAVRAEHGVPHRSGVAGRLRGVGWPAWLGIAIVVTAVAGGVMWWRWASASPGLVNACNGVSVADDVPVEVREAAGVTERRVGYVDGATVELGLCLSAADQIELTGVRLVTSDPSLFRPAGLRVEEVSGGAGDPAPVGLPMTVGSEAILQVAIEGELTDCEWFSEGVGVSFDRAEVIYRYRGRTRTSAVDLNGVYTFVAPPDAGCPRPRAE